MDPLVLLHSSSPPCQHDLWLVLDLDGDGQNEHEHRNGDSAWKRYDRFTLRVSWPASVSPPTPQTAPLRFTEHFPSLFFPSQ